MTDGRDQVVDKTHSKHTQHTNSVLLTRQGWGSTVRQSAGGGEEGGREQPKENKKILTL